MTYQNAAAAVATFTVQVWNDDTQRYDENTFEIPAGALFTFDENAPAGQLILTACINAGLVHA